MAPNEEKIRRFRKRYRAGRVVRGSAGLKSISIGARLTTDRGDAYEGYFQTWFHDRLMITRASGDGVLFERTEAYVDDAYRHYLLVVLIHSGAASGTQRSRTVAIESGGVATFLPREPLVANSEADSDVTLFYLPLEYLESRGINTDKLAAVCWADPEMIGALREFVDRALMLPPDEDSSHARALERGLLELVAGLVVTYQEGFHRRGDQASDQRTRTLDLIERHYTDPSFCVETIAEQLSVSRRHLYSLFEGRDVSLATMIRNRRLEHAEYLLRLPGTEQLSQAEIGGLSGFKNLEHFTRAFKRRRGESPASYRRNE